MLVDLTCVLNVNYLQQYQATLFLLRLVTNVLVFIYH